MIKNYLILSVLLFCGCQSNSISSLPSTIHTGQIVSVIPDDGLHKRQFGKILESKGETYKVQFDNKTVWLPRYCLIAEQIEEKNDSNSTGY